MMVVMRVGVTLDDDEALEEGEVAFAGEDEDGPLCKIVEVAIEESTSAFVVG